MVGYKKIDSILVLAGFSLVFWANFVLSRKGWRDVVLTFCWLSFSWLALRSLVSLWPRLYRFKTGFLIVLGAIYALDCYLKAFLERNWGSPINLDAILQSTAESSPQESLDFMVQYHRSIIWALLVWLCWVVVFAVLVQPKFSRWLAAKLGYRQEASGERLPVFQPKKTWTKFIWPTVWILLHFQPHTNAEPLYYYTQVARHYLADSALVGNYHKELEQSAARLPLYPYQLREAGPQTVVLIIGESASSKDWHIYGYPRATNPFLEKLASAAPRQFLFVEPVISIAGYTVAVVKSFFIPQPDPGQRVSPPDLLTLAKAAGYKTFWLSNQINIGEYDNLSAAIAHQADVHKFFNFNSFAAPSTLDSVLLPAFKNILSEPEVKKFIVLHLLGSHQAYKNRYPPDFAHFQPADASDPANQALAALGRSADVITQRSEYDNSILYTDWVLQQAIEALSTQPQAMVLYLSDHGQEVGHLGERVGHADTEAGRTVPMFVWCSAEYTNPCNQKVGLVRKPFPLLHRPFFSENMFSTLLGLMRMDIKLYQPEKDLFNSHYIPPSPEEIEKRFH